MKNVFIISGPTGSGKDAILEELAKTTPFERIITSTTRTMRPGESEGRPYHFLPREMFERKVTAGEFIEHSINENHEYYGVTRAEIDRLQASNNLILWKLDWKGVESAKKLYPGIRAILITAPLPVLEARLRKRDGNRGECYFEERRQYTEEWLNHTDIYDYIVENEEGKLDEAVQKVKAILDARRSS